MKEIGDRDRRDLDTDNGTSTGPRCVCARAHTDRRARETILPPPPPDRSSSSSTPRLLSLTHNRVPLTRRGVPRQSVAEKKKKR